MTRQTKAKELGWAWSIAGLLLFASAVAAPFAVLQVAEKLAEAPAPLATGKASETVVVDTRPSDKLHTAEVLLANALIVPGTAIGPVALGQDLQALKGRLADGAINSIQVQNSAGPSAAITLPKGQMIIEMRRGRITYITLNAGACDALSRWREQDGSTLPATANGLSLGSHVSRVIAALGAPVKGAPPAPIPGPMAVPPIMVYDGLSFRLCPKTRLVSQIAVHRSNGLQGDPAPVALATPPALIDLATATAPEAINTGPLGAADAEGRRPAHHPQRLGLQVADAPKPVQIEPGTRPTPALVPKDLPPAIVPLQETALLAIAPVADDRNPRQALEAPQYGDMLLTLPRVPVRLSDAARAPDAGDPLAAVKPGAALPAARLHTNAALPGIPLMDNRQPDYRVALDSLNTLGPVDRLFQPASAPTAVDVGPMQILVAAETAEDDMKLDRQTKLALQRRLALMGYDPKGVDGIFGQNTRLAIAELQADNDLSPTGYVDLDVKSLIFAKSETAYQRWQKDRALRRKAKRLQQRPSVAPVIASKVPASRPQPRCARARDGVIKTNRSLGCDLEYLVEDVSSLFGGSKTGGRPPGS